MERTLEKAAFIRKLQMRLDRVEGKIVATEARLDVLTLQDGTSDKRVMEANRLSNLYENEFMLLTCLRRLDSADRA